MKGERLKYLRELAGLTQREFADLAGYSQGHIANIEAGTHSVPNDLKVRVKSLLIGHMEKQIKVICNEPVHLDVKSENRQNR